MVFINLVDIEMFGLMVGDCVDLVLEWIDG